MRKAILIILSIVFILISCNNSDKNMIVDKDNLLGYDYRLFQNTPAWELAQAVRDNDLEKIKKLTQENDTLINYQEPKFGNTLLFLPLWYNQVNTFKFLLSVGADPNIHDMSHGSSPLINACKYNLNTQFILILLNYGANPNDIEIGIRKKDNETRYTPLIGAAGSGNLEIVKLLIDLGANINYVNEFGQSALSEAVILEKYEVVLYLLQKGTNYKIPMYKMIEDERPVYIQEALQNKHSSLLPKDSIAKKKIEEFLNSHK